VLSLINKRQNNYGASMMLIKVYLLNENYLYSGCFCPLRRAPKKPAAVQPVICQLSASYHPVIIQLLFSYQPDNSQVTVGMPPAAQRVASLPSHSGASP
jgi:hypothetical protein